MSGASLGVLFPDKRIAGRIDVATFDELMVQGDPGSLEDESKARNLKLSEPKQLYDLWEREQWQVQELDFTQDKEDWANLSDEQKGQMVWALAPFFIGEERVTTQFSGLVMAYEDEDEEAFLTTQQVDEARHMKFFDRFYREVVGLEQEAFGGRLQRVRELAGGQRVRAGGASRSRTRRGILPRCIR